MSGLVVLLLTASCLGWGGLLLRLARIADALVWRERTAWSFGLGMGVIGWFGFFAALAGRVEPVTFAVICAVGLPGLWELRRIEIAPERFNAWTWMLSALVAAVLLGDLIEGLAPPTDADSLAYHFAIPRRILLEHHLVFVPRAVDGAVPLLLQMTYLTALALGGEQAMTLWCAISGWGAVFLTYGLGRSVLSRDWAVAAALAVATLPAFLYGAGSGQVEARLASFTVIAVIAAIQARERDSLDWAVVAGLAAGFSMGGKYTGLILVFLCGLGLLAHRRGLRLASAFAAAAVLAGVQWYGWNWWNAGDPLFPVLYGILPYPPDMAWNAAQDAEFRRWSRQVEAPLPRGLVDFLLYPITATFMPPDAIDSGRTGLGVLPILLAPFAVVGGWRSRWRPGARRWAIAGLACLGFYGIWFVFGASQRVRHYLPFMPLIIVGLMAASERAASSATIRRALAAAVAAVLLIQSAGQLVFTRGFAHRLIQGESRETFIERNVAWSFVVPWANANLPSTAKVAVQTRQWLYLLDMPAIYLHPLTQAEVEVRDGNDGNKDVRLFWRQMQARGVTHAILLPDGFAAAAESLEAAGFIGLVKRVVAAGCGQVVQVLTGPRPVTSRTLGHPSADLDTVIVVALTPDRCPLD